MLVRSQIRLLGMSFVTIKDVRDGLAFIGCQRCDLGERFDPLVVYRSNHGASVSVGSQQDWAACSFQCVIQSGNIVA
ncbi:MAG: hypothetical protein ACRD3B_18060 [Candidatus Sulfotelmatobacter sp.]